MALAELCLASKAEQPGDQANARLVILFPEMLTDAAEFCAAADTYAPGIPRWQYGPATSPQLRAIVDDDVNKWSARHAPQDPAPQVVVKPAAVRAAAERAAQGSIPASRTTSASPQLRLAGEGPLPQALDNPADPADAGKVLAGQAPDGEPADSVPPPAQLITDEELRMLLGESNDEGRT
jgi:hypothetical protein